MTQFKTFLAIILVSFLAACQGSTEGSTTATFDVNPRLVNSDPYINQKLGFSINAPAEWSTDLAIFEQLPPSILAVYTSPKDSSSLIISQYNDLDDITFAELGNNTNEIAFRSEDWDNVQQSEFVHQGFSITQYVLQNEHTIHFKLICENQNIDVEKIRIGLDYLLPLGQEEYTFKPIESSIGTLKPLN